MKKLILLATLIMASILLTQCNDKKDNNCVCIEIFSPVCGDDGVLYSNDCFAQCAGVGFTEGFCPEEANGLVLNLGDPALDGCGWVVQLILGDTVNNFRPDSIGAAFVVDSLAVKVEYKQTLQGSPCGLISTIPVIEVLDIQLR